MLRCIKILDCMRMTAYKSSIIAISSIKQKCENQAQYKEQLQQQKKPPYFQVSSIQANQNNSQTTIWLP